MTWSASQYLKFEDERTRPARDLLVQVPVEAPRRVVDVGCGPGNSTELLVERYPEAEIIGMDSSADMLASARKRLPGVAFVQADTRDWLPREPVDLVFANAVFQWVPDHLAVLARLMETLVPGGVLALQIPDNFSEPSHSLMRESAAAGPWAAKLGEAEATREIIPQPRVYYDRLKPLSARVDIWHTVYNHPLESPRAIVEWLKSTGLRPYLAPLNAAEQGAYLADFESRIAKAYPPLVDGRVLLRFPRLFVVATKA